jgi:hypothetical protein
MKKILVTNWHSMRWIRLAIGLLFARQALQYKLPLFWCISVFSLFQAVFNTGCSLNGCGASTFKNNKNE